MIIEICGLNKVFNFFSSFKQGKTFRSLIQTAVQINKSLRNHLLPYYGTNEGDRVRRRLGQFHGSNSYIDSLFIDIFLLDHISTPLFPDLFNFEEGRRMLSCGLFKDKLQRK